MSKIEYNDIDLSSSKVRQAPSPLEGFFVPGVGLVNSIGVNDIGYTLKPVLIQSLDQRRKTDEAKRNIENGNSRLAIPMFTDVQPEAPIVEAVEDGEMPGESPEQIMPISEPLVSLGFEVHAVLTLETDGEPGEPELFHIATVTAHITDDMYDDPAEGEEPLYMNNVLYAFDEHVKGYMDKIADALNKSEQWAARAATILSANQSAAARMGEVPPSQDYQKAKDNIAVFDRNAMLRITKLVATPDVFMEHAIGYEEPETEGEPAELAPVDFNSLYEYLQAVTDTPDDLAFRILEVEAELRNKYAFDNEEASDEEAPAEEEAEEDAE